MRRPAAITLLVLMLVAFLAPAALATVVNPLPACCRRDGKHRCGMALRLRPSIQDQTAGPAVRSVAEPCPYRLKLSGPTSPSAIAGPARQPAYALPLAYSAAFVQTVLRARISEARSHHKRGPPPFKA